MLVYMKTRMSFIIGFLLWSSLLQSQETIGLKQMISIDGLPFKRDQTKVIYEGSISKKGDNADWDWWLYQDKNGEWVLLDVDGPGCIYNFVVHHNVGVSDPVYRFYFDGSKIPAFEIKHSEFGRKFPFIEPLAAKYEPKPVDVPLFAIVRSFCPMPFKKSCKVTSSEQLRGNTGTNGPGGWGHIMYHIYPSDKDVETFTGKENYQPLLDLWKNVGEDPKSQEGNRTEQGILALKTGDSAAIYKKSGSGFLASIKLYIPQNAMKHLTDLWIKIKWEGEKTYAINCPIGAFFGNELGLNNIRYITHGMTLNGDFYSYFPMPFWKSALIELINKSTTDIPKISFKIAFNPDKEKLYQQNTSMHFRASAYQPPVKKDSLWDSHIASITGHGHFVSGTITGWDNTNCEGDVRVLIDGASTPSVESDGSESWSCYGWGFINPPRNNPVSGFDGKGNELWSMTRICLGDFYPFHSGLRFSVEGGNGVHAGNDIRSGVIFYYGEPEASMILTDFIDVGELNSETNHNYKTAGSVIDSLTSFYEGEFDLVPITEEGRKLTGRSTFNVAIAPENKGVILRRRSDQGSGRQRAKVFVDGILIKERDWYFADRNPFKRWLDDEFFIPERYTIGKSKIEIMIEPVAIDNKSNWNEYFYWIYSQVNGSKPNKTRDIALPLKAIPAYLNYDYVK
jgi:hypothetical protein